MTKNKQPVPKKQIALLLALVLACLSSVSAFAQPEAPVPQTAPTAIPVVPGITDNQVNAVARQLYCPVCENTPLDVCPTKACAQWRELIRLKLSEGWTAEQIIAYFVQQYGDRVVATPPARGLNWLVYIIPPIAFLSGAFILFRAMRAWRQPLAVAQPNSNELPLSTSAEIATHTLDSVPSQDVVKSDYLARLEEELRKSDQ